MGTVIYSLVLVFVMFTTRTEAGDVESSLVYACYPNATLKIENPGGYEGVFANNSNTLCNTTFKNGKLHLYITGCPLEVPISVTFSNYSGISSGMLGGDTDIESFLITCNQLPSSGVFRDVDSSIGVKMLTSNQSTVYPLYNITSRLYTWDYDPLLAQEVVYTYVGDQLLWAIDIQEIEFILRPELCIAYPGRNLSAVTNSTNRKRLTELGCSVDLGLTTNFNWTGGNATVLLATVYAFRFFESEYITIDCDVRICPLRSTYCDIACSNLRRKRQVDQSDDVVTKIITEFQVSYNFSMNEISNLWVLAVLLMFFFSWIQVNL